MTGDGAKPYHDCRTAGCRRQAPGPFPPSVCGIRELHCCVHCYDTNGTRHSRECETYTADSTTVSSQEGEDLQVLDTHLEHVYTYERDGSVCSPGGTSAAHPDSDSETVIDDNDGDNVQQSSISPSGGAPATRMYGGFGPEPEGGNPDDVFIDDGEDDDDDEVDPIALTVGPGPPPDDPDDVFVDDDDDDDVVDPTTVAPAPVVTSPLAYGAPVVTSPDDDDDSFDIFIDDGDGEDIVNPVALAAVAAANRAIAPGTLSEDAAQAIAAAAIAAAAAPVAIPPDDDTSDASASDTTPAATPADVPSPTVPSVIHICDTAGCLRRPGSDPASFGTIGYHVCCDTCAFSNGQTHTNACQAVNLTADEYHAWRLSLAPAPAPPSSGNSGSDGRGAPYHDDDYRPGWHNYSLDARDISDAPTPTTMPAPAPTPTPTPTPASAPLPTLTPFFPVRVDGEFCRGCNICVGRVSLPTHALALCHCSCGQCEYGVYHSSERTQGGLCDFCCGFHVLVPQHNTYANRCHCDCNGCYRGRERLGILYDDESWIDHQTNDGEDPDSAFSTL